MATLDEETASKLSFEKLKPSHDVTPFDCDDADLNSFLKDDALRHIEALEGTTHLVIYDGKDIVGFFTLLADSIKINDEDRKRIIASKGISYRDTPGLKIGRFAVDRKFQKKGHAKHMLKWIVGHALQLNDSQGCRVITVDSYPKSVGFYKHFGFKEATQERTRPDCENILLYADLWDLKENDAVSPVAAPAKGASNP